MPTRPWSDFLGERRAFVDLVVLTLLLTIGLDLLSSTTSDVATPFRLIGGLIATTSALTYFIVARGRFSTKRVSIHSFFAYDRTRSEIVDIREHEFSRELARYSEFAFMADASLYMDWLNRELGSEEYIETPKEYVRSASFVMIQMIEYYLLEKINATLQHRLDLNPSLTSSIETFSSDRLGGLFGYNRFFDLFSRPPDLDHQIGDGVLHYYQSWGKLYRRAQLHLPRGSNFARLGFGLFMIDSRLSRIDCSFRFDSNQTTLSHPRFEKIVPHEFFGIGSLATYQVQVEISVSPKWRAMFYPKSSQDINWIDQLFDSLLNSMSTDKFIERMGPDLAGPTDTQPNSTVISDTFPKSYNLYLNKSYRRTPSADMLRWRQAIINASWGKNNAKSDLIGILDDTNGQGPPDAFDLIARSIMDGDPIPRTFTNESPASRRFWEGVAEEAADAIIARRVLFVATINTFQSLKNADGQASSDMTEIMIEHAGTALFTPLLQIVNGDDPDELAGLSADELDLIDKMRLVSASTSDRIPQYWDEHGFAVSISQVKSKPVWQAR